MMMVSGVLKMVNGVVLLKMVVTLHLHNQTHHMILTQFQVNNTSTAVTHSLVLNSSLTHTTLLKLMLLFNK
eukprot:jgi/Orpsp1_1/1178210/evm.model.c7180000064438.1